MSQTGGKLATRDKLIKVVLSGDISCDFMYVIWSYKRGLLVGNILWKKINISE